MRFGNGAHLDAEGVRIFSPAQVYFTNISADEVSLSLPAAPVLDRGNTLDGLNLTAKISAPYPEVLRVQLWHYMGIRQKGPAFPLAEPHAGNLKAEETEDLVIIRSGSLRLEIRKADAFFTFFRGEELLTSFGGRDAAYVKPDWRGKPYDYGSENAYMRQKLPLDVGELVYGLGERFGPFVKNGQTVAIGPGQTNRIWAVENGIKRCLLEMKGAVMASDAFFPFDDCVTAAAEAGVTAIVQPGGSVRDQESIDKANEMGIAMVFSGMRHFKH
jgi:alpha-glucosidase (family GH31 glycosyl hydrolase)